MITSFQSINELLDHVAENTDEIIDAISENDIDTIEDMEKFLSVLVDQGLLNIVGVNEDGNNLYRAV
jgi:hypothetical protein